MNPDDLVKRVGDALKEFFPTVLPRPRAFGVEADFLAQTSEGVNIVVEVKAGRADESRIRLAIVQVQRYQELLGAQAALIVFEQMPPNRIFIEEASTTTSGDVNIIGLAELERVLRILAEESSELPADVGRGRVLSVALPPVPFSQRVMDEVIVPAAQARRTVLTGLTTIGASEIWHSRMVRFVVRDSSYVIVDITGTDPGVMFVLGYALGVNKRLIVLTQSDSPTRMTGLKLTEYDLASLETLRDNLIGQLNAIGSP